MISRHSLFKVSNELFVALFVTQDGWTPLYIAAQNGHVAVVKALIKLGGAKVDIVDNVRLLLNTFFISFNFV